MPALKRRLTAGGPDLRQSVSTSQKLHWSYADYSDRVSKKEWQYSVGYPPFQIRKGHEGAMYVLGQILGALKPRR